MVEAFDAGPGTARASRAVRRHSSQMLTVTSIAAVLAMAIDAEKRRREAGQRE